MALATNHKLDPFLSIVIPAFNEADRIPSTIRQVLAYLSGQSYTFEVLVVNDGSTDSTVQLVEELAIGNDRLTLLNEIHRGKGHAVKIGMLKAKGSYRFLCDADLAMPIDEIAKFLPPKLEGVDVAIGSREAAGASRHGEPVYRHLMGRVFNLFVRMVLGLYGVGDTQAGCKCFTARAADHLFGQQRVDGFGFDVEVLCVARNSGMTLLEIPVNYHYGQDSKVNPVRDALRMVRDALCVRWRLTTGQYDRLPDERSP